MALRYLTKSVESNTGKGSVIWESKETITSGNGNTILLPNEAGKVDSWLIALVISSGNGKIQHTISNRNDVISGLANWIDWDSGSVTTTTTDVLFNVSAVRCVNTSGTIKIEVRCT